MHLHATSRQFVYIAFIRLFARHRTDRWILLLPVCQYCCWVRLFSELLIRCWYYLAFISCHLDYCNAVLYSISDSLFKHLQSIQNAVAHFLMEASRSDHISPVLRSLHWLLVKQWVDYKLATLVYKSLQCQAISYLIADSGCPQLRSAHTNVLTVPRTNTWLGDRSFSVSGPRIWNSLPASLQ